MGLIYKLIVGDFWYVGKTINKFKIRYNHHKRDCFNKKGDGYNNLKYVIFRKMGITKDNWNEMVKYEIIFERHFDTGREAMQLEKQWLENTKHLRVNTGLLKKRGNTETFRDIE